MSDVKVAVLPNIVVVTHNGMAYDVVDGVAIMPAEAATELVAHHPLFRDAYVEEVVTEKGSPDEKVAG